MSQFAFLAHEWHALFEAAGRAEATVRELLHVAYWLART
jgi:hypothetical protein